MKGDEANFNRGHAQVGCKLLVLLVLVPVDGLDVAVLGGLQGLLHNCKLETLAPDHRGMEPNGLVHQNVWRT